MIVYTYNAEGIYTSCTEYSMDVELSANETLVAPPEIPEGKRAKWAGASWELIDKPDAVLPKFDNPLEKLEKRVEVLAKSEEDHEDLIQELILNSYS